MHFYLSHSHIPLLSLAPQPRLRLGFLQKTQLNFLEASQQFSFLQGRVVSTTPNPHPGTIPFIWIESRGRDGYISYYIYTEWSCVWIHNGMIFLNSETNWNWNFGSCFTCNFEAKSVCLLNSTVRRGCNFLEHEIKMHWGKILYLQGDMETPPSHFNEQDRHFISVRLNSLDISISPWTLQVSTQSSWIWK
jgi:hypothetical protein